jgi:hypothetical protein
MTRYALFGLLLVALAAAAFGSELPPTYRGMEIAAIGAERVAAYRDLKVKDENKRDLLIVRLEVRWTAENRHLLIEDDDLRVRDANGRRHKCAFTFVQATASPGEEKTVVEIPFRVKKDAKIVSLEVGKIVLPLESAPAASQ